MFIPVIIRFNNSKRRGKSLCDDAGYMASIRRGHKKMVELHKEFINKENGK